MLKQGVKTINAEFIRTRALSQLSFVQFRPCATCFLGLLSLTLMPKSKKTQETSVDLVPSFKTSVDLRVEGLVSNVDCLENLRHNFIQKKYGRKRRLPHTRASFSGLSCFFLCGRFTPLTTSKCKKIKLSPCSLNSFYYFLFFWFKGLSFKTQFKIDF